MKSPFEQFEIVVLKKLQVLDFDFSITNFTIYLLLTFIIITTFLSLATRKMTIVPNHFQAIVELIYSFIFGILLEQTGPKGRIYFPALFTVFSFILVANLLGTTPFGFTITAHIALTLLMSLSFFSAWIIVGLRTLGFKFFHIFLPKGIPAGLMPLLVVIEILSFLIRPLSLAIRLFANMLAGHILLYIIASAAIILAQTFFMLGLLPFAFILAFFVLEIGIAFLQAYVFTILLCIYLSDSFNMH